MPGCYQASVFVTFAQFYRPDNAPRRPGIDEQISPTDSRLTALRDWLTGIDGAAADTLRPASEDASFRRYFRLEVGDRSCIAMDAPPPQEDCRPFVAVAEQLAAMNLNAPRVLAADVQQGFLLLSDLGTRSYLAELEREPDSAGALYADAIAALLRMQSAGADFQSQLPPYDRELLEFELSLFHDWLCERHIGIRFSDEEERQWRGVADALIANALEQPRAYVHRDYHSRNLMVTDEDNPGILDFQDAVEGPVTYDLVSLLKDCYIRWPAERVREWAANFHAASAQAQALDAHAFARAFDLMGMQRHLKAAGIFARLNHRDGKPAYLLDVPRTLAYVVDLAPDYPEFAFLFELIEERVLPALEAPA